MFEKMNLDFSDRLVRKSIDQAVRKALNMEDAQFNNVWAEIKKRGVDNKELIASIKKALS